MNIVDTHTHIYLGDFESDFDHTIQRALDIGIQKMLLPNIDLGSLLALHRSVEAAPSLLYPMIGLHPSSVKSDFENQLNEMYKILTDSENKYVAIGETGIDLYWDVSTFELQVKSFERQIAWALDSGLPLVIHSRNAFHEIVETLEPYRGKNLKGVFHCFTGSLKEAEWILDFGFYLGIGGVLTYKKTDLPTVLSNVPRDRVVIETDAPYLSPVPYRGQRNEPSYIVKTLDKLSEIWQISVDQAAEVTYSNARNLFPNAWR
ncbi:MAG: TatD family hydrolase [Thermaurantimonas sp.]